MKSAFCVLFLSILLFSSCTVLDRTQTIYYNESKLSIEDIEAMAESFSEPDEKENLLEDGKVCWTDGGSVWHLSTDCGHISDESELHIGSTDDAQTDGKTRVCSVCEKDKD